MSHTSLNMALLIDDWIIIIILAVNLPFMRVGMAIIYLFFHFLNNSEFI